MTKHAHKWSFQNVGGATRVKIHSGDDIRNLEHLDQKMWTVLSCPINGLEIDAKSMAYADCDGDGRLRVNEVIATSKWLCEALTDPGLLCKSPAALPLSAINQETALGEKLYKSAKQIVKSLGKESEELTKAETSDNIAIFAKTRFNGDGVIIPVSSDIAEEQAAIAAAVTVTGGTLDRSGEMGVTAEQIEALYTSLNAYKAWQEAAVEAPFGADTDTVIAAYNALDAKVQDFFVRSELAAFDTDSIAALDVQVASIAAISAENLTSKMDEIATYPLARITGKAEIPLHEPVNPAWAAQWEVIKSISRDERIASSQDQTSASKVLTKADWSAIGAKLAAYTTWLNAKAGAEVEALGAETIATLLAQDKKAALLNLVEQDKALAEEAANIQLVDKLVHLTADFYTILKNFITLQDFYSTDKHVKGIFQAGTLIIDQRACHLCLKVDNAAAHNSMAPQSGMYLIYCDCTTKSKPNKISIVAAMTMGDTGDISVGKNAIFYDRNGLDWDAVVTKIVDNPISIGQAFWSPYKRLSNTIENLINKRAAEKDAKVMGDLNTKVTTAPAAATGEAAAPQPPFDIAKFAGIFAAFGMALGMIGTALVSLARGLSDLMWWQLLIVFVAIILCISGPSMIMAWMKLRKRNLAPLLNANGWAINAASVVNIAFGNTLTDIVKFPKLKLKDPYAKKGLATWKKWVISLAIIAVLALSAAAVWYFCFREEPLPEPQPIEESIQTDTTKVAQDSTLQKAAEDLKKKSFELGEEMEIMGL